MSSRPSHPAKCHFDRVFEWRNPQTSFYPIKDGEPHDSPGLEALLTWCAKAGRAGFHHSADEARWVLVDELGPLNVIPGTHGERAQQGERRAEVRLVPKTPTGFHTAAQGKRSVTLGKYVPIPQH